MLHKYLRTLSLSITLLLSGISYGQSRGSFPSDSTEFFKSMRDYLSNVRSKEGKDFMKQFESVWYGGYFTEEQRTEVYKTANKMLERNYKPFPHFKDYLYTVGSFVTDETQSEESFISWQNTLSNLLEDRRQRNFISFMDFSSNLFRENAIYYSASNIWAANNNNYIFSFDSLPKIVFNDLDLICYSRGDSMKVRNTSGTYYPTEFKWVGKGGKVTWERAGMEAEKVYAELGDYEINTKYNYYTVDSVKFFNSFYLNEPLLGRLEDKLLANMTADKTPYPQFDSYTKRLVIQNIFPDVNFDGGFSMRGSKLLGTGEGNVFAKLEFFRKDTLFLKAYSDVFSIRTDRIVSTKAGISFYLGMDSITHPSLDFKYLAKDKLVTLFRDDQGVSRTPYTNSFHQIEMSSEVLNWKTDEPIIELTNLKDGARNTAYFSSIDFFKEEIFEVIGGFGVDNPLYRIQKMVIEYGSMDLSVKELSYYLNMSDADTRNLIVRFTSMGFLTFNFNQNQFTVKQKLIDFVRSMRRQIDYDVLNIQSKIDGAPNGKINLLNYDLTINGIPGIIVSDSQKVVLLPENGTIVMHKNRSFDFKGQVKAGRFDFFGKEFAFDYQNFKIDLVNVDSMQMKAPTGERDERGFPVLKRIRSVLQDINGELLIDNFGNRSGLKDFPEYPIFTSKQNSYVYYDKNEVLGGVYSRDKFYFQVEPFTIDSLDNFTNEQLSFNGTFTSANIFPDFKENLTLQEDFSLGFKRTAPPSGYPTYGGKGQYYEEIQLSNRGLRGDGKLEYITSTTYSNDFVFYVDSMKTRASEYFVDDQDGGPEYPPIIAEQTDMYWLPYKDVMDATTTSSGMTMYDSLSNYEGTTTYSPNGVKGEGTYHFEKGDLTSSIFEFGFTTFKSDTASFQLKDADNDGLALKTNNVNAFVDYDEGFAHFKANGKVDPIELPKNEYICYMEEFRWYMESGIVEFTSNASRQVSAEVSLEGSKFVSTRIGQDSLFFYSPSAKYDSRDNTIEAREVQYIHAADARVYPDSGKVTILEKAEMLPLLNSRIVANSITEHHEIYKANTRIAGRKSYTSSGYTDYIDRLNEVQTIYLENIYTDTTGQTVGVGTVSDSANFTISPQFAFRGKVNLLGNNEFLVFDGVTQISHECEQLKRPWMSFKAEIDPNEIFIPIDSTMRSPTGAFITSSMNINTDSIHFYSGFLTHRTNYSDIKVLSAYGFLHYDIKDKQYKVSSKEKIRGSADEGNYLSLDVNNCKVYGEGLVTIGAASGNLKFNSAGNINHRMEDNNIVLDLMSTLNFFIDERLMDMIADDINENTSLKPTDFMRKTYEEGLREIIGTEKAEEMISQLSLNGRVRRMPDELRKNFVFNDLKLEWVQDELAYKTFGDIGISNINRKEVNKYVEGALMITKSRGGDIVDLLIQISPEKWYYFNYRRNLLKVISSNEDFNQRIKDMKRNDRRYDNAKGEAPFTYMFGVEREKERFYDKFKAEE